MKKERHSQSFYCAEGQKVSKKQFNRDYFCRLQASFQGYPVNLIVSYDTLLTVLGDELFSRVLGRLYSACAQTYVCKPVHGVKLTFVSH